MSVEPFKRLVRLMARAFYDDVTAKGDNHQPMNTRSDNRGIAVVVLDALTRRQWVREEDLAKALHLHLKQLRRTLQILKDDKLVAKDQRKETAKGAKVLGAAATGTSDGQRTVKGGEDKMKTHTHSYWCLDYAQEQLKPLTLQLARLKDLSLPEFETLQAWEARANVAAIVNDPYDVQVYGVLMPLLGDTRVEVALPGGEVKEEEAGTDAKTPNLKVLPPWMIKQGMNLTKEQRGEMEQCSAFADDKKTEVEIEDKKSIQDEYTKADYAAMVKRQEQKEVSKRGKQEGERDEASLSCLANDVSEAPSERKVGEKSKWEEDGDDDAKWEAEPLPIGSTSQIFGPTQGVEASVNEDDIDWEEG